MISENKTFNKGEINYFQDWQRLHFTVKPRKWLILGLVISKNRHFQVTIKNRHLRGLLVIWAFLQGLTLLMQIVI